MNYLLLKSVERVVEGLISMLAKPCFPMRKPTQNTALPAAQPKMADAIFGFGLSQTPERSSVLARKNGEIGNEKKLLLHKILKYGNKHCSTCWKTRKCY
jgi:hypothetical protein